ncbi:MAG TPA: hypothetical protein VGO09_04585 [Flavisolibacter sp.]|nr:hypothetical protein [Flavisolibacter sp.]
MKSILLSVIFIFSILHSKGQNKQVINLPPGNYETPSKSDESKWVQGNIIIIDQNRYKTSANDEVGEYRFSVTAQRLFFINGPLKHFFAKTSLTDDGPAIVLPTTENEHAGLKLVSDIWCYYKR